MLAWCILNESDSEIPHVHEAWTWEMSRCFLIERVRKINGLFLLKTTLIKIIIQSTPQNTLLDRKEILNTIYKFLK